LTVPNGISLLRIALIPVYCAMILDPDRAAAGVVLFGAVLATDWVDGYLARRLGQVSELGKLLDPVADRVAIAAGLIALVVAGIFPLWAALLILVRDLAVLLGGLWLLRARDVRLEVRWLGKVATFSLMIAVPFVAWGQVGTILTDAITVIGWVAFTAGILEYYVAGGVYAADLARIVRP
jgi:cardiolipin synthase